MKKRQLGSSELSVSEMGLGCMSLGTDEVHASRIIEAALDAGINYFDTADLYDFGENETIVGKALKSMRDQVIIATKVGNRWNESKDSWSWDPSKKHIKEAVKQSLKRLQTDYIDLYQLHGGTTADPIDETIEAFEDLKDEGFIRYYGISSIRPNVIKEYAHKSSIVSVMMQYSLLDRRPEEWFSLLEEKQISVVTRGPIAKGLITDHALEKASQSIKEKGYLHYSFHELEELINELKAKFNRPLNDLAFHYNLSHQPVAAVVPGASSVKQLQQNITAIQSNPLSAEQITLLKQLTKETQYTDHR